MTVGEKENCGRACLVRSNLRKQKLSNVSGEEEAKSCCSLKNKFNEINFEKSDKSQKLIKNEGLIPAKLDILNVQINTQLRTKTLVPFLKTQMLL